MSRRSVLSPWFPPPGFPARPPDPGSWGRATSLAHFSQEATIRGLGLGTGVVAKNASRRVIGSVATWDSKGRSFVRATQVVLALGAAADALAFLGGFLASGGNLWAYSTSQFGTVTGIVFLALIAPLGESFYLDRATARS